MRQLFFFFFAIILFWNSLYLCYYSEKRFNYSFYCCYYFLTIPGGLGSLAKSIDNTGHFRLASAATGLSGLSTRTAFAVQTVHSLKLVEFESPPLSLWQLCLALQHPSLCSLTVTHNHLQREFILINPTACTVIHSQLQSPTVSLQWTHYTVWPLHTCSCRITASLLWIVLSFFRTTLSLSSTALSFSLFYTGRTVKVLSVYQSVREFQ